MGTTTSSGERNARPVWSQERATQPSAPFCGTGPRPHEARAEYAQADAAVRQALASMEQPCAQELAQSHLGRLRRKVLTSLQTHWPGLTLFGAHPQIPMDNNRAPTGHPARDDRAQNYYGSGSKWSAHLLAPRLTLLQTLP
jgi:transposase